ncbi:MAG: DUF4240 domain-containing protein [Saprospiraceae bacterium]
MNEQILWMLVKHSQEMNNNAYQQSQLLIDLLSEWSITNIYKFENIYWKLMKDSYETDLWAAAFVVNDGCTQEEFLNFRSWLLLQGQATFRKTVQDPEYITEWLNLPIQNPIQYPDLHNKIAELIAYKTSQSVSHRFSENDFELQGEYWQNDLEIMDKVPVLCQIMGWGNQVPKGEWKTDDLPQYHSAASRPF